MHRRFKLAAAAVIATLALGTTLPSALAAVNWQIGLAPAAAYPNASGSSQYQAQSGQRELQVEVDHVVSLAGSHVNVFVNGVKFGSPLVNAKGIADVVHNTELGQRVPVIQHGSTVRVRTLAGVLIASGAF